MMIHYLFTIRPEHLGHSTLVGPKNPNVFAREAALAMTAVGRIQKHDVGKRVFKVGDIIQVENDEQRDARS